MIDRTTAAVAPELSAVLSDDEILEMRKLVREVATAEHVKRYAVRIVSSTHPDNEAAPESVRRFVKFGSSPRGVQALILAGKVRALVRGRSHLACEDVPGRHDAGPAAPDPVELRGRGGGQVDGRDPRRHRRRDRRDGRSRGLSRRCRPRDDRTRPPLEFDGEFLQRIEFLNVVAKKILAGLMRADRKSARKGSSAEFADPPFLRGGGRHAARRLALVRAARGGVPQAVPRGGEPAPLCPGRHELLDGPRPAPQAETTRSRSRPRWPTSACPTWTAAT